MLRLPSTRLLAGDCMRWSSSSQAAMLVLLLLVAGAHGIIFSLNLSVGRKKRRSLIAGWKVGIPHFFVFYT